MFFCVFGKSSSSTVSFTISLSVGITRKLWATTDPYGVSGELREEGLHDRHGYKRQEKRWERTKIRWVFLRVSERRISVPMLQVQPISSAVKLSVFVFFLLPLSFPPQPTSPWCPVSASRHHGSAFSDSLYADGCRDYACHFRLCSPDRSVFFPSVCLTVSNRDGLHPFNREMCPLPFRRLLGQYFASTMVIVGMSVVATVIVLQFHHHSPNNGQMPRLVSFGKE